MIPLFTRADWAKLPEGFPAELIEGILVRTPAPTYGHQRFAARIRHALVQLVGPDCVPDTPADVALDDVNVYEPDVVVLREPARDDRSDVGIPLLVVEVLSPSTQDRDRKTKARHLLASGVAEVWLVDATLGTVEVRRPGTAGAPATSEVAREAETLASTALPGFSLCPATLFTPAR